MSVIPQLTLLYNKYRSKSCAREYNRIMTFSNFVVENFNEQLINNYSITLHWLETTFLKNVDIIRIITDFNRLCDSIPKIHDTAKRFGDCLRVWLACNWEIYSHLLINAKRENCMDNQNQYCINISMDQNQITSLKNITGSNFEKSYKIFVPKHERENRKIGIIQYNKIPLPCCLDVNYLLNHRRVVTV